MDYYGDDYNDEGDLEVGGTRARDASRLEPSRYVFI
jgi:hypothetical protein